MGSVDDDSSLAESSDAEDSVLRLAVDGMFKKDGLEGFQRLVVPQKSGAQGSISFGSDRVFVIANTYGDVLKLSRGSAKPPEMSPEIMCLDTSMVESDYRFSQKWRSPGLGLRLGYFPSIEPSVAWVNGRWPYITYAMNKVVVSVLLIIENGILSQQTSIANPSGQPQQIKFFLPLFATIKTLKAGDDGWESEKDNAWLTPRKEKDSSDIVVGDKPRVIISIFHNGQQLNLNDDIFTEYGFDFDSRTDSQPSAGSLFLLPDTEQRLVVRDKLGSDPIGDPQPKPIAHMHNFLKNDQIEDWYFVKGDDYDPIFRRHLEHILHNCLVTFAPDSRHGPRIPFVNDVTFKSRSTPAGDLHMFRYLLMMHQVLKRDDLVRAHPVQIPSTLDHDRSLIRDRIKKACQGHLRWCFHEETMLATYSWPLPKSERGVESDRATSREEAFAGSLQILKLSEYAEVFGVVGEDKDLVNTCLELGGLLWLHSLLAGRDEKSKLWYKYKKTYIAWEGRSNEGSSELDLPEYRLGDLIYIWKAIKSLEILIMKDGIDGDTAKKLQSRLQKSQLRHHDVRMTILQRFIYHNPQAQSDQRIHKTTPGNHGQDQSNHGVHETTSSDPGQKADYFTIAVRRSRARDRLLFYAKDTLLHDGIKWGFFERDIRFHVLNSSGKLIETNVAGAWENTLRAQGADQMNIWENTLRFALAIAMAKHEVSLDIEEKPEELEQKSWSRLVNYVLPDGRFADRLGLRKKRQVPLDANSSRTVEIPTLLLRLKFESVDFVSSRFESSIIPNGHNASEGSDVASERSTVTGIEELSYYSRYDHDVMKKKRVAMAKMIRNSSEKVDPNNISDPPGRKLTDWMYPFPDYINVGYSYNMAQAWETWKDELCYHLLPDSQYDLDRDVIENFKSMLDKAIGEWRKEKAFGFDEESAMVIDPDQLGQGKPKRQQRRWLNPEDWLDSYDLDYRLNQARREEAARKRFHYLAPLQVQQALILYLASPRSDRHNMARFFHRHGSFTSHLHEDVHPLADVWATELHLSFYSLVKKVQPEDRAALNDRNSNFRRAKAERKSICDPPYRRFPFLLKNVEYQVSTASLSYRLVGDMGDKMWTGYLLTYCPEGSKVVPNPGNNNQDARDWFKRELKNHQRKLLEPFIVTKMAAEAYQNTNAILDAINKWVLPDSDSSSKVVRPDDRIVDVQRNRSTICTELDVILDRLDRLTKANTACLKLWVGREADRQYKPRWSEKDELKYRELVDHQNRRAHQQIAYVADQCQQIQATIDLVKGHGKQMINSINLAESQAMASNSENIRIFTYATVLFYPLTFVAGLFSMQNAPVRKTTIPFLQGTAIALVLTLLIVSNAETLAWPVRRLRYSLRKAARNKMERTDNVFPFSWKRTFIRMKDSEEKDVLHDGNKKPQWHRSHLIYFFFLIIYLLVEFPVLRIQLAYESLHTAHHSEIVTLDLVVIATTQVLIAIIILPVYLPFWIILLVWNSVRWISVVVLKTPYHVWNFLRERTSRTLEAKQKEKFKDEQQAEEVRNGQEPRLKAQVSQSPESEEKGQGREKERKEEESTGLSEKKLENMNKKLAMEREKRQKLYVSMLLNPPQGLISAIGIIQGRTAREKPQTTMEQETESLFDESESTMMQHIEGEKDSEATKLSEFMAEMEPDKLAERFARWILGPGEPSRENDSKWNLFPRRHHPKKGSKNTEQDQQEALV